jgi:hypothetical protein
MSKLRVNTLWGKHVHSDTCDAPPLSPRVLTDNPASSHQSIA